MNYLLLTAFVIAYWLAIFWVATVIGRVFAGPRDRTPVPPAQPRARYIATRENAGVVVFLPDEDEDDR